MLSCKKTRYIPGVGIDTQKFGVNSMDFNSKRQELGIKDDDMVLLSVGELNRNKNHETVISAIATCKNMNIQYFICGTGELKDYLIKLIKDLNLESQVHLLGFRTDVLQILKQTDVFVHPSFREGLPVSIMEAMASSLPIIAGNNRGTRDLIIPDKGGYLVKSDSIEGYKNAISILFKNKEECKKMGKFNANRIKKFDIITVNKLMQTLYFDTYNG